jgi:hypothetical protein
LPSARNAPRSLGAMTRGGLSGDPGKDRTACSSLVLVTRLPGPEGRKCVTSTVRDRPNLNDREVPGGWECSNPESFAHGQRRTAQFACAETRRQKPRTWEADLGFVPGWAPRTRVLTTTHPGSRKRRRRPASRQDSPLLVPGKGRGRDELERLSLDGNDGRENLGEDPKDGFTAVERDTAPGGPRKPSIRSWCTT